MNLKDRIETMYEWLGKEYGQDYDEDDLESPVIAIAYTELYDENCNTHLVQVYYDVEKCELIYCVVTNIVPYTIEEIHREHYDPEWIEDLPYDELFCVYNEKFGWY